MAEGTADGPSIAIVGGGIGGLTLAACLLRSGGGSGLGEVRIYEQAPAFSRVGTGIQMGPNAMKVLAGLGLRPAIEPVAYSPAAMGNRSWDKGDDLFSLPLGAEAEPRYGAPYYLLHRGDLHQVLYSAVPASLLQLGSRVVGVSPSPGSGGRVRLSFEDGTFADADVVVGADGVHSVVRSEVFPRNDAHYTGRVAYRAVYPVSLLRGVRPGPATKWWGVDRHIVIYYVSAGSEVYFTTSVPEEVPAEESWSAMGDHDELLDRFEGFHPEVQSVLDACPEVHKWPIYDRFELPTWHSGSVVLLGDACHPMTPYMAQGAATTLEDAVVLSRLLASHGPDSLPDSLEEAFEAFEAARKPRATRIQETSRTNTWLREPTDPSWVYSYDAWQVALG